MVSREPLTFGGFARDIAEMRKLGSYKRLLGLVPQLAFMAKDLDETRIARELGDIESVAAILSLDELRDPGFLPDDLKRRDIAAASGVPLEEVELLFQQFEAARRRVPQGDDPLRA